MSSTGARNSSRSVFTANQWQELEHQALIFKHMVSGVPVPPQLLHSLKTTSSLQPPNHLLVSHHHHHQQQQQEQPIGWGCFQAGFGRKADPEPGRCRRTDGKKWRCSKEAHPDSKYCEKHMHRGRNRSRKPVELEPTNSSAPAHPAGTLTLNRESLLSLPTSTSSAMPLMPSSSSPHAIYTHHNPHNYHSCHPMYPHFFDSSRAGIPQDYRLYYHGARDAVSVDKRAFFPGASSGNMQRPLATAADANGGSYNDQIYGNIYSTKQEQQQQQPIQEQCFVLGADIKSFRFMRPGNQDHETQKPAVHHQFLEDWDSPPEDHLGHSTNWLDLASNPRASK